MSQKDLRHMWLWGRGGPNSISAASECLIPTLGLALLPLAGIFPSRLPAPCHFLRDSLSLQKADLTAAQSPSQSA